MDFIMLTNSSYTGLNSKSTTFFSKILGIDALLFAIRRQEFFCSIFSKRVINGFRPQAKRWPPPESFATEKESFFAADIVSRGKLLMLFGRTPLGIILQSEINVFNILLRWTSFGPRKKLV